MDTMYYVYILKSEIKQRFYIGYTNNLKKRLLYHNGGKVRSTKAYRPWKIIYTEQFDDRHNAFAREKQIKSYKGGEAFKKLIQCK
jgi:putative endonuclease